MPEIQLGVPEPMSVRRKGEIALAYLQYRSLKDGIELRPRVVRGSIGNIVKEMKEMFPSLMLEFPEAMMFAKELAERAMCATFDKVKVGDSE